MKRTSKNLKVRMLVVTAALSLSSTVALAIPETARQQKPMPGAPPNHQQTGGLTIVRGLRPNVPHAVSHQKPVMARLKVSGVSWGENVEREVQRSPGITNTVGRDPYRITIHNANRGTELSVYTVGPANPAQLPNPENRAAYGRTSDGTLVKLPASLRKQANKDYNRAVRAAVATARPETLLFSTTANGESSAQAVVIERPEILETNTQIVVRGIDPFGRKYQEARGTIEGAKLVQQDWSSWRSEPNYALVRTRTSTGGRFVPSVPVQIEKKNLFITPVLDRIVDGQRQSFAKLLSLAGFSPNSEISVTNTRMAASGAQDATRTFRTNATGSGAIEVPALLGDSFYIQVRTPRGPDVRGAIEGTTILVPRATQNGTYFGGRYLPVE